MTKRIMNGLIFGVFIVITAVFIYKNNHKPKGRFINSPHQSLINYPYPRMFEAKIDWIEFVKLNHSQVVPLGQQILLPIEIEDAAWTRGYLTDSTIHLELGATFGDVDVKNVVDISESVSVAKIGSESLKLLLPLTVNGEGYFYLNIYGLNHDGRRHWLRANVWVSSFGGKVRFSDAPIKRWWLQ